MQHSSRSKEKTKLTSKLVIGLMSGTSMDGIDAALIKIFPEDEENSYLDKYSLPALNYECISTFLYPFPEGFRQRLNNLVENKEVCLEEVCKINFLLGELLAQAAFEVTRSCNMPITTVDLIGSHGQTIYHLPGDDIEHGYFTQSTLQIGEPSIIAQRTGVTTIADFRPRDIAAGGEGAPLVCFADLILFSDPKETRLIQNIGGISNVTVIPPDSPPFAFDTGPGNILINIMTKKYFNQEYDKGGAIAITGSVDETWIDNVIRDEIYFHMPPPKTTGREHFNYIYSRDILTRYPLKEPEDIIANFSALTAKTIANAYKDFVLGTKLPDCIILGGGGAYNTFIVNNLKRYLDNAITIKSHEDFGISNKFKEAIAFAILAYSSYFGITNNVPLCTGATENVVMGKIIPGNNYLFPRV